MGLNQEQQSVLALVEQLSARLDTRRKVAQDLLSNFQAKVDALHSEPGFTDARPFSRSRTRINEILANLRHANAAEEPMLELESAGAPSLKKGSE